MKNYQNLQFFADISIGNPPQTFRSLIDIAWSDLFVPSWSRTYVANGSESMLGYNGIRAEGHLSQDTLYVAGLEIRDQLFHELVSYVSLPTILWTQDFDAVLGLAPFNDASFAGIQNPFQNMISQGLLDANIISLSLGGTTAGESIPGEIMYGGINYDLMEGELIRLPATETWDADQGSEDRLEIGPPVLNGTWQVEVRGISWGDESAGENYEYRNLNGFTAILETASPWIILPPEISERLDQILEPEYDNPWFAKTVDCLKRDTLPALTFNMAGYNFTLSPYEYTIEVSMGDYGYSCVVAYAPLEREMVPPDEPGFIVLGSSFLRGFNSVFDFDRKEVGCKFVLFSYLSQRNLCSVQVLTNTTNLSSCPKLHLLSTEFTIWVP